MRKILKLYAVYNRDMDKVIIDLLSKFTAEELKKERPIFCHSLYNLFIHIARSAWFYQAAIRRISNEKYCRNIGRYKEVIPRIESSFQAAAETLHGLDESFIAFVGEVTDADMELTMNNFETYDGRKTIVSVWEVFTQHITHQTHHRGQLSQVLDELGVVHDIGNIWPYVRDAAP